MGYFSDWKVYLDMYGKLHETLSVQKGLLLRAALRSCSIRHSAHRDSASNMAALRPSLPLAMKALVAFAVSSSTMVWKSSNGLGIIPPDR